MAKVGRRVKIVVDAMGGDYAPQAKLIVDMDVPGSLKLELASRLGASLISERSCHAVC